MLGAYLTYYGITYTPIPWYLVFLGAAIFTGIFGVILERLAYRPLRGSARITVLISAIGASFLLQNLAILIFGGRAKAFPIPEVFNKIIKINVGSQIVSISLVTFIIPVVTILLLVVLTYFI